MKKVLIISFLFVLALSGVSLAVEYSADYVTTHDGEQVTSKMYYTKDKSRMEVETEAGKSITIIRFDKKEMWTLMPEEKMYLSAKLPKPGEGPYPETYDEKDLGKPIGREKVAGVMCDKYKVASGDDKKSFVWVWISKDDKIVMKTASADGSFKTEVKNLKKGKQDPSLFEIPKGYKKMGLPVPGAEMPFKMDIPGF